MAMMDEFTDEQFARLLDQLSGRYSKLFDFWLERLVNAFAVDVEETDLSPHTKMLYIQGADRLLTYKRDGLKLRRRELEKREQIKTGTHKPVG